MYVLCDPNTYMYMRGLDVYSKNAVNAHRAASSVSVQQIGRINKNHEDILQQNRLRMVINPYFTYGFTHHYQLDESTFILGVLGVIFIFISFFDEICL